jgi:putative membrane protein
MKKFILSAIGAMLGLSALAQAPDPDTTARHFIIMASIGNLQEINSGHLAETIATSSDVKSYCQMMVKDHGQAQQQLIELAKQQKLIIPAEATTGIQADLKLKNAKDKFDPQYVHAMVADHRRTVQMFQTYAVTGKNPAVRAFAQQMLPILKAHLAAITAIDKQLK